MRVSRISQPGGASDADTVAIGLLEDEELPPGTPAGLGELVASGEARRGARRG